MLRRYIKFGLIAGGFLIIVIAVSAINLYADIRRIGCESAGQVLGPASTEGFSVADPSRPGACFISFVQADHTGAAISRVSCAPKPNFASCHDYRAQLAIGWSDFLGSKCTSVSFIGGADCSCTETGRGCQIGDWPVELRP